MSGAAQRDHLAYAPEHGLYALYRGAGGVALAAVLAVIGCAGAFVPWPSFELRPIASVLAAVWWLVWWSAVFVIYANAVYRLTTDVLASVEMGVTRESRMSARLSLMIGICLFFLYGSVLFVTTPDGRNAAQQGGLFGILSMTDSLFMIIFPVLLPIFMLMPTVVQLRSNSGMKSGRVPGFAVFASVLGVAALLGIRLGLLDRFVGGAIMLGFVSIALLLLAWLAVGLRRRIAAIMGAIARIEGEEAGRGEVAKVFSGEAGAGRETE